MSLDKSFDVVLNFEHYLMEKTLMITEKLLTFIQKLNTSDQNYFHLALASFFGEALFPDTFDINRGDPIDLEEFEKKYGGEVFHSLYACALEFFFSNEYPDENGKSWNVIDKFLEKKGKFLSQKEKTHCQNMRDSYMSLYEVVDVTLHESITLRDLLDKKSKPIVVKEKKGTEQIVKWDILGARVIQKEGNTVLMGGVLPMPREAALRAKQSIETISQIMNFQNILAQLQKEGPDPLLMMKKMWAKEIVHEWFHEAIKDKTPQLFNTDGDPILYCTLKFPIKGTKTEVVKILKGLSELHTVFLEETKHAWVWPFKKAKKNKKNIVKEEGEGRALTFDTIVTNPDGQEYHVYAELKIIGKKLIVNVNSQKRCDVLKNYIELHLGQLVGNPLIESITLEDIRAQQTKSKDEPEEDLDLSQEEKNQILHEAYTGHYIRWLDEQNTALSNKTPREAVKTPKGREKVIALLKDFQGSAERQKRNFPQEYRFDFKILFEALGIEGHEL